MEMILRMGMMLIALALAIAVYGSVREAVREWRSPVNRALRRQRRDPMMKPFGDIPGGFH